MTALRHFPRSEASSGSPFYLTSRDLIRVAVISDHSSSDALGVDPNKGSLPGVRYAIGGTQTPSDLVNDFAVGVSLKGRVGNGGRDTEAI